MSKFYNCFAPSGAVPLASLAPGITRVFGTIDFVGEGEEMRPAFRARGPLAEVGTGPDHPLFLLAGVGFVVTGLGRGDLIVWSDAPGVQIAQTGASLTLEGELGDGRVFVVEAQINTQRIAVTRLHERMVWPERTVRLAGFTAQTPGEWAYPDCPVRREVWPYVLRVEGPTVTAEEVCWSVELAGGRRLERRILIGSHEHDREWDSIGSSLDEYKMLAIWPRLHLPDWRLYTLVVGDDDQDSVWRTHDPKIWIGETAAAARNVAPSNLVHRHLGVVTLHLDGERAGMAPYFISFGGSGSSGFFQLLAEASRGLADGAATTFATVAIDLGTSTTVVAVEKDEVLQAGRHELAHPRIVVGNLAPESLQTIDPWLPTIAAAYMQVDGPVGLGDEIPTGIFVRSQDALSLPFCDFTICAPGLDLVTATYRAESWSSNLKWGSLDTAVRSKTISFMATVLLWMAALRRPVARQFEVRASYPLSFDRTFRNRYGEILNQACKLATEWSGTAIQPALVEGQPQPYCDESLALLHGVEAEVAVFDGSYEGTGRNRIAFHADLGAETLDLMLAWLSGETYRVIAAESVRFGADVLTDCLQRETATTLGAAEQRLVHRHQVRRAVRANYLAEVMGRRDAEEVWDPGPPLGPANLRWRGSAQAARQSVQGRMDLYAYLLAEYCGRFLAGALLDREGFLYRANSGPGRGQTGEARWDGSFLVLLRRSGNGWKFLEPAVCGWSDDEWLDSLKERVGQLLGDVVKVEFVAGAGFNRVLPKSVTALGTRSCDPAVAQHAVRPEASPNGWDDASQNGQGKVTAPWWILVGAGSKVRKSGVPGDSSDAGYEFYAKHAMQQSPPSLPDFATANGTALAPRTGKGREIWRQSWVDSLGKKPEDRRRWMIDECRPIQQMCAKEESQTLCRVKATGSVMWETLLRRIITGMEHKP